VKKPGDTPLRSETLIFLGAGATAALKMPPTEVQGKILFSLRRKEEVAAEDFNVPCFQGYEQDICDLVTILNYRKGKDYDINDTQVRVAARCFPDVPPDEQRQRILSLRRRYDWPTLRTVGEIVGGTANGKMPEEFTQSVFTTIDACLRENRGIIFDRDLIPPDKLRAARELYILLINTMFACAWQQLCRSDRGQLEPYRCFAETLAELMQKRAREHESFLHYLRKYYLFDYSILTTNFDPVFLWLIWQAHRKINRKKDFLVGSPARPLQLFIDFPNTVAMRKPAEPGEELSDSIWYPFSEVVVQKINDPGHLSDRTIKIGKYYAIHGSSLFRLCPVCGRLNMHSGDNWDMYSPTVFPPGLTKNLSWGCEPRTDAEKAARKKGEYDAESCLFCGALTHAHDNFMFMQTKLKTESPSFIKEISDEAISAIRGAKHIILLGYSLPPDDTIWRSILTAMTADKSRELYCSVVCGTDGPQKWLSNGELEAYLNSDGVRNDAVKNALSIFGHDRLRAYAGGIPQVFGNGSEKAVCELIYGTGWIPEKIFNR